MTVRRDIDERTAFVGTMFPVTVTEGACQPGGEGLAIGIAALPQAPGCPVVLRIQAGQMACVGAWLTPEDLAMLVIKAQEMLALIHAEAGEAGHG